MSTLDQRTAVMRKLSHHFIVLALLAAFAGPVYSHAAVRGEKPLPQLAPSDALLIAEVYHLREVLGDKLWPGWGAVPVPFLYISADYEYAIGFPKELAGFEQSQKNELLGRSVQVRKRVLPPALAASFPFEGTSAVVIGTPAALELSPGGWVLIAAHEMFHVLQGTRGETEKTASLKLGQPSDASWQLNFPFPYTDATVMQLIHLQSYPIYLALTDQTDAAMKYNAATAVEAIRVYQSLLQQQSLDNKHYKYSQFQEWKEGIAFYTEYKLAETAAAASYEPIKGFQGLENYKSYLQLWNEQYKTHLFLVKHAGRAARSRNAFYHLGLGKGLLLDRLLPDWKLRYFAPDAWLNDLLMAALGQPLEIPSLKIGAASPDFTLPSLTGGTLSVNQFRGKVVLLDFWQTWCPPCVEEIPNLKALNQKYKDQGLVVLGITTSGDAEVLKSLREFARDHSISYPTLLDERGTIAGLYNVSGYPHIFILDRGGRLLYDRYGYWTGKETDLEKEIQKALRASE